MYPIRLAAPEVFRVAREALLGAGLTEQTILNRLQISTLADYGDTAMQMGPREVSDGLELLLALFFEGGLVSSARMKSLLPAGAFEAFLELGLIEPESGVDGAYKATVALYPIGDILVCSDRWRDVEGREMRGREDFVYPAKSVNTLRFLQLCPVHPSGSFLDVCAGAGIFALRNAGSAGHAYAFDIAARSTHFAEFNRRLNGIENMTCETGNLYEPAGDLTFDCIVAHPPYVPVLEKHHIFYDGGDDGEAILQGIIAGLPRHLNPGGRFYCSAMASDRKGAPAEARLRSWLGDASGEFDLAILPRLVRSPLDFAVANLIRNEGDIALLQRWHRLFKSKEVEALVYCAVVLQRRAEPREVFTVRREIGNDCTYREIEWMVNWETAALMPGVEQKLLAAPVRARDGGELHTVHRLVGGEWQATSYKLEGEYPMGVEGEAQDWMAMLVQQARGQTMMELLNELKSSQVLNPETPPEMFADVLKPLLSGGFLESAAFPLPVAPAKQQEAAVS